VTSKKRITVVTAGHLSTCPRMLKAADALSADGHTVRVVATRHEPWATEADVDVRSRRSWPVTTVDYRRGHGSTYWRSGVRYRLASAAAESIGPMRVPYSVVERAFSRVHDELVAAASSQPADLIYGGTTGALSAVSEAARRLGVPYGIDFEDLHHAETEGPGAALVDALALRVEAAVAKQAAFSTTSSDAMAQEYEKSIGVRPATIHNTFPLPMDPPPLERSERTGLRVYWFSQTIGRGRGLENAIAALGRLGIPCELTIRGRPQPGYLEELFSLAASCAGTLRLVHRPPAAPDSMIELAREHDVGLATEPTSLLNRRVCLSNKAFTYLLAGLAVVISDTPGARPLGSDIGEGAALVAPDDVDALAGAFARFAGSAERLACARRSAWHAAVRRWHWQHELESGRLCALVNQAVS
jgi:glycosyltransferase involved in cell wall biosynthesis